jgi:hypothetical protein
MEYKTILRPYDLTALIGRATGDAGSSQATWETGDWDSALNKNAKDGWVVKNSGVIESGRDIVFWALLER